MATHTLTQEELDQLCINTIRFLAVDAVQKANSGHPGAPMGMAAIAYTLWTRHLRFNPHNPLWFNRDRFILSNGHASMLLYSLLYLTGYDLSLDEIKNFRQWGSLTAGHPERGLTPGVEVTTGPLGQGFANGVGMGIAEQFLASTFNKPGHEIIDHYTYVFAGDGCMEEGISSEAASLAGHLELGKLIYFYDDNEITIDGNTNITFTEDVAKRFEAYEWHVQEIWEGNDIEAIDHAIRVAQSIKDKPSLIICHTHIGYGSPNRQDTAKAHGNPLGKEEVLLTKQHLGWPTEPEFYVPEEALKVFRAVGERGEALEEEWMQRLDAYGREYPEQAAQLLNAISNELPLGWDNDLPTYKATDQPIATRNVGGKIINAIADKLPTLIGGSADLNESTFTKFEKYDDFEPSPLKGGSYHGRTINFGVREHAMAAITNGMAAHGGVRPFCATFFTFSDYMRPAVRLSALMNVPSIFIWTHDSVALGEDGPTHQPIEHLMALRAIPNFTIIRPSDATETIEAYRTALQMEGPAGIVLTRQKLPVIDREKYLPAKGLERGAYIISESIHAPQLILIATGSEVSLALEAKKKLEEKGIATRVVSMPSFELFEQQPEEYQEGILPEAVKARLSIELGIAQGWERWVGPYGASLSVNHFGASAPYERLLKEFGFTVENVVAVAEELLKDPKAVQKRLRATAPFHEHGRIASAPAAGDEGHS